jgi:hypothetical protein
MSSMTTHRLSFLPSVRPNPYSHLVGDAIEPAWNGYLLSVDTTI